jgi:hypothetical protein
MSIPADKSRAHLRRRHRLSHQQIDQWLGERSGNAHLAEKMRQLEKTNAFLTFTDKLREAGFDFVCFKGALLSQRIYGDTTTRIASDIDLLLPVQQLDAFIAFMLQNGFVFTEKNYWSDKPNQRAVVLRRFKHLAFQHPNTKILVEVHWKLTVECPIPHERQLELIHSNLTTLVFQNRAFRVLKPELELVYLMIHGCQHRYKRLKWLMDIRDYPYHQLDMGLFDELIRAFCAETIAALSVAVCRQVFETTPPIATTRRPPGYMLQDIYAHIEAPESEELQLSRFYVGYAFGLQMFTGVNNKLRVMERFFFRREDALELDTAYPALYYLYRPYSVIRRWFVSPPR